MRTRQRPRTAVTPLTTTEAAVLALLAIEGERSGYDLLKLVEKAIAFIWSPARSQLYAVLPRLVEDGFASRRLVRQSTRPDKQLYRITDAGRAVLEDWLRTVEPGAVDTFFLKLFVGGVLEDDAALGDHVRQFRRDTEERLAEFRRIEPTNTRRGHDRYHYLMLRLGLERSEQALRWADWVLEELGEEP
jgi:PadR family transcriptional regulator, regulatory protein AphA